MNAERGLPPAVDGAEARVPAPSDRTQATLAIFDSDALFRGAPELLIRHGTETYRLRRTQNGKLILTK